MNEAHRLTGSDNFRRRAPKERLIDQFSPAVKEREPKA
jgi:hypothetical protein